jgi:hypothetical protein
MRRKIKGLRSVKYHRLKKNWLKEDLIQIVQRKTIR